MRAHRGTAAPHSACACSCAASAARSGLAAACAGASEPPACSRCTAATAAALAPQLVAAARSASACAELLRAHLRACAGDQLAGERSPCRGLPRLARRRSDGRPRAAAGNPPRCRPQGRSARRCSGDPGRGKPGGRPSDARPWPARWPPGAATGRSAAARLRWRGRRLSQRSSSAASPESAFCCALPRNAAISSLLACSVAGAVGAAARSWAR